MNYEQQHSVGEVGLTLVKVQPSEGTKRTKEEIAGVDNGWPRHFKLATEQKKVSEVSEEVVATGLAGPNRLEELWSCVF